MTHLSPEQIAQFKERLENEKARLQEELATISKHDPENPSEWSPIIDESSADGADKNDVADAMEDLDENTGIALALDEQLNEVVDALDRIDAGTYGIDEATNEPIPVERLEANPSARGNI